MMKKILFPSLFVIISVSQSCRVKEYPVPKDQAQIGDIGGKIEAIASSKWTDGQYSNELGLNLNSSPLIYQQGGLTFFDLRSGTGNESDFTLSSRIAMNGSLNISPNVSYRAEDFGYSLNMVNAGIQELYYTSDLDSLTYTFEIVEKEELKGQIHVYGPNSSFEHTIDFHALDYSRELVAQ